MTVGRPSSFTPEVASEICRLMGEEGLSAREICRRDDMPAMSTLFKWLAEKPAFSEQYRVARETMLEAMADELLEISDDGSNDWLERARKDGSVETVLDREHVSRSELRVNARKWLLSKLLPRKYGDKLELSGDKDRPLIVERREFTPKPG